MIEEVQTLLDKYVLWLKDKTTLKQINSDWIEISTPYIDRHNDFIQIYAKRNAGGYLLTDDSDTIQDLKNSGCELESPKRQSLLKMTLNGFGVHLNGDALEVQSNASNFALKKHSLVQAMLAVNDMFFLSAPMVTSLFYEDVISWLDNNDVRYTPQVKFTGKSGFDHMVDVVIPKSKKQPERILQAINRPNRSAAQQVAFMWIDTKETRKADSRAYVLLNDLEHPIPNTVLDALTNYDVNPVPWSEREFVKEVLFS